MHYVRYFCLLLMIILVYSMVGFAEQGAAEEDSFVVLQFDFGALGSPVRSGWTQVMPETVYTEERGYGFAQAASSSFDRAEVFVPDWMKGTVTQSPQVDDVLRDGVFDEDDLSFRVDVPDGEYWLVVSIGDEGATRRSMSVSANGISIAENVTTQTSWGGYATARTFRRRVNIVDGKVEITFKHDGDGNSILGIEIVSFVPYPIQFKDGKWECDQGDENANSPSSLYKVERHLQEGLDALNDGRWAEAQSHFGNIDDPVLQATALSALADMLDVPEEDAQSALAKAIQLADSALQTSSPNSREGILAAELKRIITNYLDARMFMKLLGYEYATKRTGLGFSRRLWIAGDWCQQINAEDTLFDRACLNTGRIHYWFWRENGDAVEKQTAERYFDILKERQPSSRLVRIYTGEKVPWGEGYTENVSGMPEWAIKQREAMGRLLEVVRWWIDNRQLDTGEMGGGYGDDVEMLRQWHVFLGGADDATVKLGWLRLAHGIWHSGEIDKERGYAASESDVQHSAEDVADSQPAMIGLDYGNPVWLERCSRTLVTMRDFWTGVNEYGHRHFKSASIGAASMNTKPKWGVDVPCNGRATRPGLWVGWYNRNPELVKLFSEWMDSWVEDAMREENGKPAGVIPAAVAYETDNVAGYGDQWHKPDIYWSYFNWPGYVGKIYDHLLAVYDWTGDEKYLKPIEAAMELAMESRKNPVESPPEGSRDWAASVLYGMMAPTVEKYRILTGSTRYDDYLREQGSPYMRFLLTGDKELLVRGCENAAASARFNFELKTSEVLFTDRIGVTQHPMWEMITGGVGQPYYYPCHFVTWSDTGADFAALVTKGDSQSLNVIVCNFSAKTREVGMNLWRLEPGLYELRMGPDSDNDDRMDRTTAHSEFELYERGHTVKVELPPRSARVFEITKKADLSYSVPEFHDRPDLAVSEQDVFVGKTYLEVLGSDLKPARWTQTKPVVRAEETIPITVIVHNMGRQSLEPAEVKLLYNRRGRWVQVAEATISEFDVFDELMPGKSAVELSWQPTSGGDFQIIVQVEYQPPQMEITYRNNVLVKKVRVRAR